MFAKTCGAPGFDRGLLCSEGKPDGVGVAARIGEISDTNLVLPDGSDLDTLLLKCSELDLIRTEHPLLINEYSPGG